MIIRKDASILYSVDLWDGRPKTEDRSLPAGISAEAGVPMATGTIYNHVFYSSHILVRKRIYIAIKIARLIYDVEGRKTNKCGPNP